MHCLSTQNINRRGFIRHAFQPYYFQQSLKFFKYILLSIFLASCSIIEKTVDEDVMLDDTGDYKYAEWRLNLAKEYGAINPLLKEVDILIENSRFNTAIDKLERVLRIKPNYAQAWSRLSWLALETDAPNRSRQMAKRSNSFAFSNSKLQVLNWTFIRSASKALNDAAAYRRASQKIETLKAF